MKQSFTFAPVACLVSSWALFAMLSFACSSSQDLGGSGKSKAGESCAKSGDCADNLPCIDQRCDPSRGLVRVGGPLFSCPSDPICALRNDSEPYCKDGGICTECLTDKHCEGKLGPKCKTTPSNQNLNVCVDCLADSDCTDPRQGKCSVGEFGNFCVACLVDADCKDPKQPHCQVSQTSASDAPLGFCEECVKNQDCTDPSKPICRANSCSAP